MGNINKCFRSFPGTLTLHVSDTRFSNDHMGSCTGRSNYSAWSKNRFNSGYYSICTLKRGSHTDEALSVFRLVGTFNKVKLPTSSTYMPGTDTLGSNLSENINFNASINGNKIINAGYYY